MFAPICIVVCVFILMYYFKLWNTWRKMPPGPYGWPLLGSVLSVSKGKPWESWAEITKKYGPIFSYSITHGVNYIVINDYDLTLEAYSKVEFIPRPPVPGFHLSPKTGIINAHGRTWQENKRFAIRTLRDFGFGKSSLNDFIMLDFKLLAERFTKVLGKPTDIAHFLNIATFNILWRMVASTSFDHDDPMLLKLVGAFQTTLDKRSQMSDLLYGLIHHRWIFRLLSSRYTTADNYQEKIRQFIDNTLDEHKKTRDPTFNRDYIDAYLQEIENTKETIGSEITETNLKKSIRNFFTASETAATSLRWILLFMITYPEQQHRAQEEIDNVTGGDREISLEDRFKLPFTEALILESLRMGNPGPIIIGRSCHEDTYFHGFLFPKNCVIYTNVIGVHFDPKHWENPEKFDPTRFLDQNGHLMTGNIRAFYPFGIGKRQCPGENLGRMELFLFLSNFLQRYTFEAVPGERIPTLDEAVFTQSVYQPPYYRIIVKNRK